MTIFVCRRKDSLWFSIIQTALLTLISGRKLTVFWETGEHMASSYTECQSGSSCLGLDDWEVEPRSSPLQFPSPLSGLCVGPSCSVCCFAECNRQGVLADRAVNCSFYWGCPGRRTPGKKDSTSAMGQLCCFPFAREEEKISKCDSYCAESRVWLFSVAVL